MTKRPAKKMRLPVAVKPPPAQSKAHSPTTGETPDCNGTLETAPNWQLAIKILTIIAAVWWIYWPSLNGDWTWDDDKYITNNPLLRDPERLWKAWFCPGSFIEYYPIEQSIQWLQWQFWGNDTLWYHITNVTLHTVSSLLVWRLFQKLGLPFAWLGGLIFAIHPMQVESVAWISELKNTLSLPPFLLSICAWLDYERSKKTTYYWQALAFFLVAMLCKISMALFPIVLVLYAWWKRNRIDWVELKSIAPFFIISLVLGITTCLSGVWYSEDHLTIPVEVPIGGLASRLALSGLSIAFYFARVYLPILPLPIYPQWEINPPSLVAFLPWPILAGILYCLWKKRHSWGRPALFALGFFAINLAPFIGFITVSYMHYTWVSDHLLYIPMLGLIGFLIAGLGNCYNTLHGSARVCGIIFISLVIGLLGFESRWYSKTYADRESLWTYTVRYNPQSSTAHYNLGNALIKRPGRLADAIAEYKTALELYPKNAEANNNLGIALAGVPGHLSEAIEHFKTALEIEPTNVEARKNLTLAQQKLHPQAAPQ